MSRLRLAPNFALDADVAGEAIAILAKRGAGKTNTARVLVEELHAASVQVVVLDPVGAWWGLRYGSDRTSAGLSIPIIGGKHGDIGLEPTAAAGRLIADVVVDSGESIIVDLADFPSKASMATFTLAFAEHLYQRKGRSGSLLHLVLEEADLFAPQNPKGGWGGDGGKMAAAIETIVRRGRSRGLGLTMITQRSAVLNKDVLTQTDVLIVMRTTGPQDIKAIGEWVNSRGDEHGREVLDSLPSLETGEAWIWNPERDLLKRVHVRRSNTFDSGATPKVGEKRAEPTTAAKIDLDQLGEAIAATVERAKENDPAALRKRIHSLELANKSLSDGIERLSRDIADAANERIVETTVEVPVLDDGHVRGLEHAAGEIHRVANSLIGAADTIVAALEKAARPAPASAGGTERGKTSVEPRVQPPAVRAVGRSPARPPALAGDPPEELGSLPLAAAKLLTVLGQFPEGRTGKQLGVLAGYKSGGSSYRGGMAELRRRGLASPTGVEPIVATPEGLAIAPSEPLPTGRALYEHWLGDLPKGARVLLELLYEAWPNGYSAQELAEAAGYKPGGSSYRGALAALRRVDLATPTGVDPIRASDELMETM